MRAVLLQMKIDRPMVGTFPKDVLSEAMELYETAIGVFTETIRDVRQGQTKEAASYVRELSKIVQSVLTERERLEKLRKSEGGVVHDYALDFDGARDEIGRRLARLRDAGGR